MITSKELLDFIRESNKIEGILREPTQEEITAHEKFLKLELITIEHLKEFVAAVAPGAELRERAGMDVIVGGHRPIRGGQRVALELQGVVNHANKFRHQPYEVHQEYESLHPFIDGNGRSGRALWLWMMDVRYRPRLGFLHSWYYQSLDKSRDL